MNTLFDLYEAHALPVVHHAIAKAWKVLGGTDEYRVELTVRGEWTCTCPHHKFRVGSRGRKPCKHVEFVKALESAV